MPGGGGGPNFRRTTVVGCDPGCRGDTGVALTEARNTLGPARNAERCLSGFEKRLYSERWRDKVLGDANLANRRGHKVLNHPCDASTRRVPFI